MFINANDKHKSCNGFRVHHQRHVDVTLQWRHNGHGGVSNHQPHHCLLKRIFGCRTKKTSKLRVTGLCAGNSSVTGVFPEQMASIAENVSIWWHHRDLSIYIWSFLGRQVSKYTKQTMFSFDQPNEHVANWPVFVTVVIALFLFPKIKSKL